jgi:hypothetical protein
MDSLASPLPPMSTVPHPEGFQMFEPVAKSYRTDDDCASVCWERGRKTVTIYLNCYGSEPQIRCGLRSPLGGVVDGLSLAEAWDWFCDYNKTTLPEAPKQ